MRRFERAQTSTSPSGESQDARTARSLTLRLEGFAWESIGEEAAREGLPIEELIGFAVLYYLADVDSGRISRQVSRSPHPQASGDRLSADGESAPVGTPPISRRR